MKRTVQIFLLVVFLCSCKEISFRQPQPKGRKALSAIPAKLQGKYLAYQENGELAEDTIIITRNGYLFSYHEALPASTHRENYDEGVLSDTLVLKSYRGYYFLNLYEEPEWLLRVIKQEKNGDLTYMAMEQDNVDFNDYIRKLSYEIAVDSVSVGEETLYHIDPPPSKLIDLIEKGFFTKTALKKIQ